MNKYIAVVLAVLVVLGTLLFKTEKVGGFRDITSAFSKPLSLAFPDLSLDFSELSSQEPKEAVEAWEVFSAYRKAAKGHDLVAIRKLSYQLSDTCKNPQTENDCFGLMDNVYNLTQDWEQGDFKKSYFDSRQVVIISEKEPLGAALVFVRDNGELKVLGIKWCLPDPDSGKMNDCFNTNPAERDQNDNGWWDDVEELFR